MRATDLPCPTVGATGIFPLLAERLATLDGSAGTSTPPAVQVVPRRADGAAPTPAAAPARGDTGVPLSIQGRPYMRQYIDPATLWALTRAGLWMRVGFVGASVAALGLVQLFGGTGSLGNVALVAGGVALTMYAWQRTTRILDRADAAAAAREAAAAPSGTPDLG